MSTTVEAAVTLRPWQHPGVSQTPPPATTRFAPDRAALGAAVILLMAALPVAASGPWFTLVLLAPVLWAAWLLRARVVTSPQGLEVCNGLAVRTWAWADVEGYDATGRGPVRVFGVGRRQALTAVPRRRLRALLEASDVAVRGCR